MLLFWLKTNYNVHTAQDVQSAAWCTCNVKRSHVCFGLQESDMTTVRAAILLRPFHVFPLHTDNKRRYGRAPTPIN